MLEQYREFRGTAEELGELATTYLRSVRTNDPELTERLIRYYTQVGILDRPIRAGREAMYGYRQLLQLLCARVLATNHGLTLAQIAEFIAPAADDVLLQVIPKPGTSGGSAPASSAANSKKTTAAHPAAATQPVLPLSLALTGAPPRRYIEVSITTNCRILVDETTACGLTSESIDALTTRFRLALHQIANQQSGSSTQGE